MPDNMFNEDYFLYALRKKEPSKISLQIDAVSNKNKSKYV